jgi:hypothetical protein
MDFKSLATVYMLSVWNRSRNVQQLKAHNNEQMQVQFSGNRTRASSRASVPVPNCGLADDAKAEIWDFRESP